MHYFIRTVLSLTLISISVTAHALQQIQIDVPGEQINVNISTQTLTRIAIAGDRINKIISDSSQFITETDPDSGAVFIRAQDEQAFSLFLSTEMGNTYHLLLTPGTIEADNIEIIPHAVNQAQADDWLKRTPYESAVTQLIQSMVNRSPLMGYQILLDVKMPAPLFGNSLKATPLAVYQGKYLQGIVFTFTNTGKQIISLSPDLLTHTNILAVAFVDETLDPKQSTTAYQVSLRGSPHA